MCFPEELDMKLDDKSAKALRLPEGKSDYVVFDDKLHGFGVRLREGGARNWIVQFRVGSQQRRKTIGSVEKLSAGVAREAARRDLAAVELGGDPMADKAAERARAAQTLEHVAERYLSRQEGRLRARSYAEVRRHLRDHWLPLMGSPVAAITRRDVAARLQDMKDTNGGYAANRARASLSALFAWAIREGLVEANPVIGTNRPVDEQARDRVLDDAELVAIWRAARGDDYGMIVRLLMLTGQRREEVGGMAKAEIDLVARKWTIPAHRTKNARAHEAPLSDLALELLKAAIEREGREDRNFIFGQAAGGFTGWSPAKSALDRRIANATGVPVQPWRLHDLRRTAATRMADLGVQPHVIEAVLNHVSGSKAGVAGVYNRAAYSAEKRQALDLWAAHVEAIVAGLGGSNVVSMRRSIP
jgi:integrase